MERLVQVLVALGALSSLQARKPLSPQAPPCGGIHVAITVSPLIRTRESRILELSWDFDGAQPGDQVALYDYDPVVRRSSEDSSAPSTPPAPIGFGPPDSRYLADGRYGSTDSRYAPTGPDGRPGQYGPPAGYYGPTDVRYGSPYGQANPYGDPYSPFPIGYPRDSFSGRARREETSEEPLAVVDVDGLRSGWRATSVQERHVPSGQLGYTSRCLNYWVAYERRPPNANETEILAVSCLRTRPNWMSSLRRQLGHERLTDLLIPGTHDSASVQEEPKNNIVDRYSVTQDESTLGQLIYGVRYIDLRVGFYPGKDTQWWANHGPVRMQPLQSVLHDVKAFIDNTNEIVILDVQEFPAGFGRDNKIHMKLVHLLETELGELMAPRELGWSSTLEDIWQNRRRLLVGYDKEDILPFSRKLWTSVRQFWGDAQTQPKLNEYVTRLMQRPPRGFPWALMAELTPNARIIATNPTGSLRRLAHQVNRNVTTWAHGSWGGDFNVLAVDFIRSTGVVEASLEQNLRRSGVSGCELQRLLESA